MSTELAQRAMDAARRKNWNRAFNLVNKIQREHGPDELLTAVFYWLCQTVEALPTADRNKPPLWHNLDTGKDHTADEVPPGVRWSGWLLTAVGAGDDQQAIDLLMSVPDDETWSGYVADLLMLLAMTQNKYSV